MRGAMRPAGLRPCLTALTLVVLAAAAPPALAQERPVTFLAGAALNAPLSGTADHFNPGPGVAAGAVWHFRGQMGLRVDGAWSVLRPKDAAAGAADGSPLFDVSARVQYATASFVFQAPPGPVRLYVLAGTGIYRRSVRLSARDSSDPVTVCNPWWFVCESDPQPVSRLAATRSTTNLGVSVGVGIVLGRVFVEGRYHYAAGPSFQTSRGEEPATGKFFPLIAGIRF